MKSTGIVRRIDQLGRVVIPKETRDILDLPTGTPMEIFTEGEAIVLCRYQVDGKVDRAIQAIVDVGADEYTYADVQLLRDYLYKLEEGLR